MQKVLNKPGRMQPVLKDIVCIWTVVASNTCALLHNDKEMSFQILSSSNVCHIMAYAEKAPCEHAIVLQSVLTKDAETLSKQNLPRLCLA